MSDSRIPCSVQILTRNSAGSFRGSLEALRSFEEVIVQDGYSTDETRTIAQSFLNVVLIDQDPALLDAEGRIADFAAMRNRGIARMKNQWVLVVDTGEVLSQPLVNEVRTLVQGAPAVFEAFRRFYLDDKRIDHCSGYPAYQIRLFHRSLVDGYIKTVHERLALHGGVQVRRMSSELPELLPPLSVLPKKYAYYRALECRRLAGISFGWWIRGILFRNIRSAILLSIRLLLIWLVPRKGKRMPLAYELLSIKQLLLLIPAACPLLRRKKTTTSPS